ncbi:MAG: adenylyl-sulfate kinase [Nitrospira sp.]|nr:adenylyl-sulfate kinase [Nitrospira sp.]
MTETGGFTIWLTGLPGAGKTTLVRSLAGHLQEQGRSVELLDGDELRRSLTKDHRARIRSSVRFG